MIDVPRLKEGGIDVIVFVIHVPFRLPFMSHLDLVKYQVGKFKKFIYSNEKSVGHACSYKDIINLNKKGKTAILLALEGGHSIDHKIKNLEFFSKQGFLYITLTHFLDNDIAGTSTMSKITNKGLTPFGREVISAMENLKIFVDIAHCSNKVIDQILSFTTKPVIYSHGALKRYCNLERNLTDEHLKEIVLGGGLFGITVWPWYLQKYRVFGDTELFRVTAEYTAGLLGSTDGIVIGSDMDAPIWSLKNVRDVSDMPNIIKELQKSFNKNEISKIMGKNFINFLEKQWN